MAKIDQNNGYTALAKVDGSDLTAPIKVDPVSGMLLVEIHAVASSTPELNTSGYDENNTSIAFASNGTSAKPFLIDNRNGYLWCDVA